MKIKILFFGFAASLLLLQNIANAQFPALQWAKKMGGTNFEYVNSTTVDDMGNIYTVGSFEGTVDFDPGAGIFNLTSLGKRDIYISKLDAMGNFVWAKQIGRKTAGTNDVVARSITTDNKKGLYITGNFNGSVDFDPSSKVYNLFCTFSDVFILKLDTEGNFNWARNIGGAGDDFSTDIAVDLLGNVYTCGRFIDTADFDPGPGAFRLFADFDTAFVQTGNIFLSKLDSNGLFIWAKQIGGLSIEDANAMDMDSLGNIYITGGFIEPMDFDPSPTTSLFLFPTALQPDIFIAKIDSSGKLVWVKQIGGSGETDRVASISIDLAGNVYTTGYFSGTIDFDPSTAKFNMTSMGEFDIYICKLDHSGKFVWAKQMGGLSSDMGTSIAVDKLGNVYTTGTYTGTGDFDPGTAIFNLTAIGFSDNFTSKLDPLGNLIWARSFGGDKPDYGKAIVVDKNGYLYTTGEFYGTGDFDPGSGIFNMTSNGWSDIFINKISQTATKIPETIIDQEVRIYPNPSDGIFRLLVPNTMNKANIEVVDIQGKSIYCTTLQKGDNLIDLSIMADGLFFVKINTNEGTQQFAKIIKQTTR